MELTKLEIFFSVIDDIRLELDKEQITEEEAITQIKQETDDLINNGGE